MRGFRRLVAAANAACAAVIYDGGFAEQGAEDTVAGIDRAICCEAGIACGPNCMGVLTRITQHDLSRELRDPAGLAGNVGLVSQSGAVCISLLSDVRRFGFSHVASSGNEAVLAAADYLEYLVEDPHTEVIGAFIETIREPERFVAALDRAAALGKPVVALKVGRSERARLSVPTHTGGSAGDPESVSALLRTHRAIEVADLVEMTEALAACRPRPVGRRIGVITSSGGLASILDTAERAIWRCRRCPRWHGRISSPARPHYRRRNPLDARWRSQPTCKRALFDASPTMTSCVLPRHCRGPALRDAGLRRPI
jgi:acyl-CoA synthetase (NDP forming)